MTKVNGGQHKGYMYWLVRMVLLAAVIMLPVSVFKVGSGFFGVDSLYSKLALASAALTMPEGGMQLLEERFYGDILDTEHYPQPSGDQNSSSESPSSRPDWSSSSSSSSSGGSGTSTIKGPPPEVEERYRGTIQESDMSGDPNSSTFHSIGTGFLRNYTTVSYEDINAILETGVNLKLEESSEPQVLIFHTHATESFESHDVDYYDTRGTWRSTDNENNMVAVGDVLTRVLEDNGITVIHDTTLHDYPSYNGSYIRSAETVSSYLEMYPSIKVVLDLHRDAIEYDGNIIVKPVIEIEGKKAAQLMIISSCDNTGSLGVPQWRENLRFAAALTNAVEEDYPGLMRPIYFANRKYNMDLSTGALLLEFGTQANTLEEAMYTAELAGESLSKLLLSLTE